jgi:hypothetical protein
MAASFFAGAVLLRAIALRVLGRGALNNFPSGHLSMAGVLNCHPNWHRCWFCLPAALSIGQPAMMPPLFLSRLRAFRFGLNVAYLF